MAYVDLPNSSYLEFTSYRGNGSLPTDGTAVSSFSFNVALVLERANDPSALLEANWATRQQQLSAMDEDTLWSTYGADPAQYADALSALSDLGISTVDQISAVNGYVSSVESRTIWVQVDETNFTTLFGPGAELLRASVDGKTITYWEGNLSLSDALVASGVKGVVFDGELNHSVVANPGDGSAVTLPQGPQSVGNSASDPSALDPNEVASLYNFPFNSASTPELWKGVQTGTIGLIEPSLGTALPPDSESFQHLADEYRASVGLDSPGVYINVAPGGTGATTSGERSLDLGVVTAVSPTSAIAFYAGSGVEAGASSSVYTAVQAAFWDTTNNPEVISSSWADLAHFAPGSPFAFAYNELYIDAVLRNITVFNAAGDGGSGAQFANGLTNVQSSNTSPYSIVVGGTSLSTTDVASDDTTLTSLVAAAKALDPATIWALVAGGLTQAPSSKNSAAFLLETVWNGYALVGNEIVNKKDNGGGYYSNEAGAGGVDPSQPQPSYQTDYGLNLTTSDPSALPGRGIPDVAAIAGGNLAYNVPTEAMTGRHGDGGTSAATPMWAALAVQFNAIFSDQELPQLGYMNDLLYIAAAIAPAAFNDVTLGNNTSSFSLGGSYLTPAARADGKDPEVAITPTGYGYSAGPGYDLTTGLGTPNGLLLARALTTIAHSQMSFAESPAILESDGSGGWTSTESQSLLIQTTSDALTLVTVSSGSDDASIVSLPSAAFAWTSRFAQQALQPDFDVKLVKLFDNQSQGALTSISTAIDDDFAVVIDAQSALAPQAALTTPFGFVDFVSGNSDVRIARPVAVAETVDALDGQQAVIRMRQVTTDKLAVKFYQVDDFAGTIDGLAPGDPGYSAAADARAYATTSGATSIKGPGYGKYGEAILVGVDAGDLIAMKLTQGKKTFWAFASANETVDGASVGHLWNYGLNTWGWESSHGGGDRDFNDLLVQLDFTSGYGEITGTDDVLKGGKGNDTLSGLGGFDTLKGGSGDEILLGGKGDDGLHGGAGADTLNGDDGNDRLDGGKGIDTLNGGDGDDILQVRGKEGAYDTFDGGAGTDTLQLIGTVTLAGFDAAASSIEILQGAKRGLNGTNQADVFDLSGLTGAPSDLRFIDARHGDDIMTGSNFADDLRGGKGDDTLDGRGGDDMLDGGKGRNTFVFADGYDNDTIVKFQAGNAIVDLTGVSSVGDFSELALLMQQDGKNVLIDFGNGDTLTLQKTTIDALAANQGDFLFA